MIPDRAIVTMACGKAATVAGTATILIKVPADGRKINGGTAWFETHHADDKVQVYVTDEDNLLGYGAGAVIAGYTDSDVPVANRGWYMLPITNPVKIERLVDFGHLPAHMYIKIVGETGDNRVDTLRINLHWGK